MRFVFVFVAWLALTGAALAEPRVALVIGNSNYGGALGQLPNPANDARLMAKTLKAIGFTVIEAENADQAQMKRAIQDFGQRLVQSGAGVTGLFFYAGHGLQVAGTNYLIPIHAKIEREPDVDIEAVPVDLVMKQMEYAESAVNIVILDACRNNPLSRGFRAVTRGLADPAARPMGSFIAYSTAPGDVAEDGKGANSPYTLALAQSITRPGASINDVFQEVRGKVLAATDKKQVPWDSSSLTAPFYFVPAAAPAGPSAELAVELAYWDAIKDSRSAEEYRAYLAKYPNGKFVDLAKSRLAAIQPAVPAVLPAPQPQKAAVAMQSDIDPCLQEQREVSDEETLIATCTRLIDAGIADLSRRSNAFINRGHAQYHLDRLDAAKSDFEKAIDLTPSDYKGHYWMGRILYAERDYQAAHGLFDKAVRLDPGQALPVIYRGASIRRQGDFEAARRDVELGLSLDAEADMGYDELTYLHLHAGDLASAVAVSDRALQKIAGYYATSALFAFYFAGRHDDALAIIDRGMRDDPGYAYWWIWKAMIQRAGGDKAAATATLADARNRFDKDGWPLVLVRYLGDNISESEMRRLGRSGSSAEQAEYNVEIEFYVADQALYNGDKASAVGALQRVEAAKVYPYYEYMAAPARLAALQ